MSPALLPGFAGDLAGPEAPGPSMLRRGRQPLPGSRRDLVRGAVLVVPGTARHLGARPRRRQPSLSGATSTAPHRRGLRWQGPLDRDGCRGTGGEKAQRRSRRCPAGAAGEKSVADRYEEAAFILDFFWNLFGGFKKEPVSLCYL